MKKTILLTGATDGLGALAAEMLAQDGHHLLLHGRNQERLDALYERLSSRTDITCYRCDLSSLTEVSAMTDAILAAHKKIDVIINNAGVLRADELCTAEGLELRFAVNTIAPFIITERLLPLLPAGGRIVNLSSAAQATLAPQSLTKYEVLGDMPAYSQSKLAITAWTRRMAAFHPDKVFIAVNPASLLGTKMVKQGFGIDGSDIRVGSDIICRAAISDEFSQASGLYYDNDAKSFGDPHHDALDDALADEIIDTMRALCVRVLNQE